MATEEFAVLDTPARHVSVWERMLVQRPNLPFVILLAWYPAWWLLGIVVPVFFGVAALLAVHLWRRRADLVVPRGFGLWLLFLIIVVVSVAMLTVDAPFAVEGGGLGRLGSTSVRMAWYATITISFVYLLNVPESSAPFDVITRPMALLFVWAVLGAVLGLLAPNVETVGLFAHMLPGGLLNNDFVHGLVKIDFADTVSVLGYQEARPKAPFVYANDWGANVTLLMPFFVWAWIVHGRVWERILSPFILGGAVVGLVYSINRAAWAALAVAGIYALVQLFRLRPSLIPAIMATALASLILVTVSGLGQIVTDRLSHPHSNDRRAELAVMTVESTLRGSPILGFGNTRNVQGSFASIAGGDTPDCRGCGVPPLGTQGYLWLVLFAQGLLGVLTFLGYMVYRLVQHIGTRDGPSSFAVAVLLIMFVELPFYDLLGVSLLIVMLTVAELFRREDALAGLTPQTIANT